jgi:predicted TIM-barrel fold metal-dependent hydrolase
MARFAEAPNARVKISGLGQRGKLWRVEENRWIIEQIIAMFGAERAMFASNFPVDSLCASFDTIYSGFKEIAARYPLEDQEQLFCGTARSVYRTGFRHRSAAAE